MVSSKRKNQSAGASPSKQPSQVDPNVEPDSSDVESTQDEEMIPVQVNNACLSELNNALDDTMKSYLTSKAGFKQDYFIDDVKLGLGWMSNFIAAGISLAGWHFGWEKTQASTLYCVVAYVILSTILNIFSSKVEKNKVFVGTKSGGSNGSDSTKVTISVNVKPYEPIYEMELVYESNKKNGPKKYQVTLTPHFKDFFDVDGVLDEPRWNTYLKNALQTAVSKF